MLENFRDEIDILMMWYEKTKEVAIIAESLDTQGSAFIQPLHEQRYSFDHFIRAIAYEQDAKDEELIKKALSSAISHLQRAFSDCIEWILISIIDEYTTVLKPYTSEQINKGFSQYYTQIRPGLDRVTNLVNNYKINKSVEKASIITREEENSQIVSAPDQYISIEIVEELTEYLQALREHQSILEDIKQRDNREAKNLAIKDKFLYPIITGIIGAVIGALIVAAIM